MASQLNNLENRPAQAPIKDSLQCCLADYVIKVFLLFSCLNIRYCCYFSTSTQLSCNLVSLLTHFIVMIFFLPWPCGPNHKSPRQLVSQTFLLFVKRIPKRVLLSWSNQLWSPSSLLTSVCCPV